jgi:hypothetical protein
MATPNQPLKRKLTKEEFRDHAKKRESLQRHITSHWWEYADVRIVEQLRQAHTRLMNWGNRNKPSTEPQPAIPSWPSEPSEWVNARWLVDTLPQQITPLPPTYVQADTPRPFPRAEIHTGEIMNKSTQEQPLRQTLLSAEQQANQQPLLSTTPRQLVANMVLAYVKKHDNRAPTQIKISPWNFNLLSIAGFIDGEGYLRRDHPEEARIHALADLGCDDYTALCE